jgi:metal-responsive CopG/Arc/MetJ family transcriptional regulator
VRHKETVAITITLPKALNEAVEELANREHCGNKSAVIREALYKEIGISNGLMLKEDAVPRIQEAEERTVKYSSTPSRRVAKSKRIKVASSKE